MKNPFFRIIMNSETKRRKNMVVRLKIAPQYAEPEIHICSDREDAKTKEILTSVENLFG